MHVYYCQILASVLYDKTEDLNTCICYACNCTVLPARKLSQQSQLLENIFENVVSQNI